MTPHDLSLRVDQQNPTPIASQLSQQLAWLIASGRLGKDDELPPARELAQDVGISFHTVRAAYQQLAADGLIHLGRGRRARVRAYDRSRLPATAGDLPTHSVGVIIPDFLPFYAPMLDAIEAEAAIQPTMVIVANAREDPRAASMYLDRLVAKRVDGIIVCAALLPDGVVLPPPGRPPVVFVDAPGAPGPTVEFDLEGAQYVATKHLIEHGHTSIGFISPPGDIANVAPKLTGHLRALREAGIEPDADHITETATWALREGGEAAARLLDLPIPPTAIAVATDNLAVGAHNAITARGLHMPRDVALVGNDGIEVASIIRPALTTVQLPVREAGRRAVEVLEAFKTEPHAAPERSVMTGDLVVRETCGCTVLSE